MSEEKIPCEKVIINQISDNCTNLLLLIDFLKEYNKIFEEFIPRSLVSLKYELSLEDEIACDLALNEYIKIPIENIYDIDFIHLIVQKGGNPKKFNNLSLIQELLKSYIYQEKNSPKGLISSLIINKFSKNKYEK